MKPKRPKIPCARCDGRGAVALSTPQWRVMRVLYDGPCAAIHIHEALRLNGTPTRTNNVLEALRRLKLVKRRRSGREWIYRVAK